ncbi:MAG TPA: hypothetical protein VIJ94_14595 [Caulobacteraceae bacterium]
MTMPFRLAGACVAAGLALVGHSALAAPPRPALQTRAGAFTVERPTLVSLGFEWRMEGDDNRNARVEVSYRKRGERAWRQGLPLLRLEGEQVPGGRPRNSDVGGYFHYVAPDMFAGSLLNLEPGVAYECRLVLSDPDGVRGEAVKRVVVRTRSVPHAATGGRVFNVYPYGYAGPKAEPAFTGLLAAYFMGSDQSDHSNAFPPRVRPGDTILVHAGVYKDNRFAYGGFDPKFGGYGTPFDGTYYLTESGTPDRPIVIKAAGDGEAVFDGDGNQTLFNLMAANNTWFEGITVRNTNVAFLLGQKDIAGASGFTLTRSRLIDIGRGVQDDWAGSKDFYIADNVFIGRHDRSRLQSWFRPEVWGKFPGYPAPITSEYAVKVYGQGHVIAYNYVEAWHDGIDVATYGAPSSDPDKIPSSIDFYGNDITNVADNCIEADGSAHNVRVFRNRCLNSAQGALSAQPIFGGPAYFFQNLVYNATTGGPLKFVDTPAGVLVYQNTFFGESALFGPAANVHFRNNLMIGDGWADAVFAPSTSTNYSSSDYNGFRLNAGAKTSFGWTSPPAGVRADFKGPLEKRTFATLEAFAKATGQDPHSVLVDLDIFVKASLPDRSDPQRLYRPAELDFRLRPGSAAIDRGVPLPTINDGYTGKAPDLGAYELGALPPHYGPRDWPTGSSAEAP